jgi:hypothetical protein
MLYDGFKVVFLGNAFDWFLGDLFAGMLRFITFYFILMVGLEAIALLRLIYGIVCGYEI